MQPKANHPGSSAAASARVTAQADAPVATVLGDFELRREIGRGGMGTVYEAWQVSLQRTVALKVLARHVSATPKAVLRFQREAQAAAKLHHTHIVPIFAQGEADGVYYYAMELVDGMSLNQIISELRDVQAPHASTVDLAETVSLPRPGSSDVAAAPTAPPTPKASGVTLTAPNSWEQFHRIAAHMAEVADALDYAHQRGVIHRDIKPHNLLLGSDGRLRISDFGLARLAEQPGVTMTGEVIGSPLYMSPEQISGDPDHVDPRADIYSLGATMYEWLTLNPPFPGETRERVISRILSSEAAAPRAINPAIPVDLETICLKAIERSRDRRYRNAAALRDDLRCFLTSQPISARRMGLVGRSARSIARHKFASLATTAVVIALLLSWALFTTKRTVQEKTQAVAEAKETEAAVLDFLDQSGVLKDLLAQSGVISQLPLELQVPLRAAGAVKEMAGSSPASNLLGGLTEDSNSPGVGTTASLTRELADAFYRAVAPANWPNPVSEDESAAHLSEAVNRWQANDLAGAVQLLDAYLEVKPDDFEARQLHAVLAGQLGDYEKVVADGEALLAIRAQLPHGYFWRGLAYLLLERGERSIEDLAKIATLEGPTIWLKALSGLALIQLGRPAEAIGYFDEVLSNSPQLMVARLGRALANYAAGKHREAIADASEVIRAEPGNADAFTIRGDSYLALADYAAAAGDFQEAMSIAGRTQSLGVKYLVALMQRHRADAKGTPGTQPDAKVPPATADPDELRAPLFKSLNRKISPR